MIKLIEEFNKLKQTPIQGIEVSIGQDFFHWNGLLIGPPGTPFEGGKFRFELIFPSNFPASPPEFFFKTRIFHPNVDSEGKACIQVLSLTWRPNISISCVLNSICVLLREPYPDAGYFNDASTVLRADRLTYERVARQYTANFAK
ncbi:unnamed protein product [Blepharisma stoltei]|uniref:UBC core domain-containing protein n=1 Tax=Blepharisma stoltei TaxID=1481888 RepID=A0AAU9IWS2_9CILI|nr:unnamed protein product [Blepharisma stoltei]